MAAPDCATMHSIRPLKPPSRGGHHSQISPFADSRGSNRMQFRVSPNALNDSSAEEWQAALLGTASLTLEAERTAEASWTPDPIASPLRGGSSA